MKTITIPHGAVELFNLACQGIVIANKTPWLAGHDNVFGGFHDAQSRWLEYYGVPREAIHDFLMSDGQWSDNPFEVLQSAAADHGLTIKPQPPEGEGDVEVQDHS